MTPELIQKQVKAALLKLISPTADESADERDYISKEKLVAAAEFIMSDKNVESLTLAQLYRLMTVTQYVTDLCLNEIEQRGELTFLPRPDGSLAPIIPYTSEHHVETILTRA